jgi:hypothetical protein
MACQGIVGFEPRRAKARERLDELRNGRPIPGRMKAEIRRELERLDLLRKQIAEIETERDALLGPVEAAKPSPGAQLLKLEASDPSLRQCLRHDVDHFRIFRRNARALPSSRVKPAVTASLMCAVFRLVNRDCSLPLHRQRASPACRRSNASRAAASNKTTFTNVDASPSFEMILPEVFAILNSGSRNSVPTHSDGGSTSWLSGSASPMMSLAGRPLRSSRFLRNPPLRASATRDRRFIKLKSRLEF